MATRRQDLYHGIIDFYRSEMARRYALSSVRRFPIWASIDDVHVERLRAYFLDRIYPPAAVRDEQDHALEAMRGVFRSSKRLAPLTGAALRSLWRLGRHAPAAVTAAVRTLEAYVEARHFEQVLLQNAERAGLNPRDTEDRDTMLRLLMTASEREVRKLINDMMGLFRILANIPMLKAGVKVMDSVIDTMEKKHRLYTPLEVHGVRYAADMVRGGLELVDGHFDNEMVETLVSGIETVEDAWFSEVTATHTPLPLDGPSYGRASQSPNPA